MAKKYKNDVKQILDLIGRDNIISVAHCVTRLRFVLKDPSKVDISALEKIDLVRGTFTAAGQFQIIIGPNVALVYDEVLDQTELRASSKAEIKAFVAKKGSKTQQVLATFSEIFVAIIPALIAGGLILAFQSVLTSEWVQGDPNSELINMSPFCMGLNSFLNVLSNAVFGFLPVLILWSMFERSRAPTSVGVVLGICLVSPAMLVNYYDLAGYIGQYYLSAPIVSQGGGIVLEPGIYSLNDIYNGIVTAGWTTPAASDNWTDINDVLVAYGITGSYYINSIFTSMTAAGSFFAGWDFWPLAIGYVGQVAPALLVGWFGIACFRFIEKHTYNSVLAIWPPLATVLITSIFAYGIIGPIGAFLTQVIADMFYYAFTNPVAAYFIAPIFGFFFQPIVITGLHTALNIVAVQLTYLPIAGVGIVNANYLFPMMSVTIMCQAGAIFALARLVKKYDPKQREVAISAGITAFFGITEPAIYGGNLRFLFPFFAGMCASAVFCEFIVLFNITAIGFGSGGILAFLNINMDSTMGNMPGWTAWIFFWIVQIGCFSFAYWLTLVFSKFSEKFKNAPVPWKSYLASFDKVEEIATVG